MKELKNDLPGVGAWAIMILLAFASCERNSSPEGRMSIKMEDLQKEMRETMQQQNQAILDSLSRIRADLNELKQRSK